MALGAKAPVPSRAGVMSHEAKVAAFRAEAAECDARGDAVGRLMANGIRKTLAVIEARYELQFANELDRPMLKAALDAVEAQDLFAKVLP